MRFTVIREKLRHYKVGIAGAGGLGSNCAQALVRSGVGTLVIADFDTVSELNLNRQFFFQSQVGEKKVEALRENLRRIDPSVNIEVHDVFLDHENTPRVFAGCDIIVEAFDNSEMKQMIIETVAMALPGIPLVVGSGLAGWGGNEKIRSRKIDNNLYVIGDESEEVSEELPPLAPRVGIVANMQANIVLEILLNK